jgi:glucose-6-phosphate dehydrogenase assembly protein OpcA
MTRSDAVWSEEGTTPDAIEAALRRLLAERHAESGSFAPARVLNMIVFVDDAWSGEIANRLRGVGRYHASRLIVFSYEPRRERLDARATIAADEEPTPGQLALLRETVIVKIGDRHLDDLLTIADPLLVTDMPTLLWSPHGYPEIVQVLLEVAQSVLLDSLDEPVWREAIGRACELVAEAYVVDLAWLRSTPWRERVAALFDPPRMRPDLMELTSASVRHHPASTVAGMMLLGWMASRLGWRVEPLEGDGEALAGTAHARHHDVALALHGAPEQQVRGLQGLTLETANGRRLSLDRGAGGLHVRLRGGRHEQRWLLPGASRGETGILGEGIRQALLRDPTYEPALKVAAAMLPDDAGSPSVRG